MQVEHDRLLIPEIHGTKYIRKKAYGSNRKSPPSDRDIRVQPARRANRKLRRLLDPLRQISCGKRSASG